MARGTLAGRTLLAATRKTDPDIGFGELGTKTATKPPPTTLGLDPDPPSAAQLREHDRMISHLAQSHYARAGLLQIFISRNLRQNGRLQLGHDSLRRPGSGEQAGEKTQNRNKDDRHNRFRRRARDESDLE